MERSVVASTNIRSMGYDKETQTLEVEFQSGSVYQYYGVPEHLAAELEHAGSKGQFFQTYIRNQYPYSRVG